MCVGLRVWILWIPAENAIVTVMWSQVLKGGEKHTRSFFKNKKQKTKKFRRRGRTCRSSGLAVLQFEEQK
jgi:hypothetical protein